MMYFNSQILISDNMNLWAPYSCYLCSGNCHNMYYDFRMLNTVDPTGEHRSSTNSDTVATQSSSIEVS
jgi:hypothetical protein